MTLRFARYAETLPACAAPTRSLAARLAQEMC